MGELYKSVDEWRLGNPENYKLARDKGVVDDIRKDMGWKKSKFKDDTLPSISLEL